MTDPSGASLGLSTDYIRHAPFSSFLIPGMVLFVVNGLLSLLTAFNVIRRGAHYHDFIYVQGVILAGWIAVQVLMVRDFNLLHAGCLLISYFLMRWGRELKAAA